MISPKKLSLISRLLLIGGSVLIAISLIFPWWGLDLVAPQYPEGLQIIVYPSKLEGEIDIINNLNHYIGMAEISEEGFPELQFIPYIVIGVIAVIVITALLGSKKLAYLSCLLLIVGGAVGIFDMYRWLNTFGTNLDPDAPITVDPFVPPIIGDNKLANFVTHSSFRIGFFILVLGAIAVFIGTWGERLWKKR